MNGLTISQPHLSIPLSANFDTFKMADEGDVATDLNPGEHRATSPRDDPSANPVQRRDQLLVSAAQSGCRTALDELFNLYSRRVYRTILAITKNSEDAEDAMQDSFLRAFLAINRFEGRANFYSWLTRIAINSALMILRTRRSRSECSLTPLTEATDEAVPIEFKDSAPDPEEIYYQRQRRSTLDRTIHGLPPDLREVVRARIVEECSVREVARRFNISEAAAKSRLYRARTRLGFNRGAP